MALIAIKEYIIADDAYKNIIRICAIDDSPLPPPQLIHSNLSNGIYYIRSSIQHFANADISKEYYIMAQHLLSSHTYNEISLNISDISWNDFKSYFEQV